MFPAFWISRQPSWRKFMLFGFDIIRLDQWFEDKIATGGNYNPIFDFWRRKINKIFSVGSSRVNWILSLRAIGVTYYVKIWVPLYHSQSGTRCLALLAIFNKHSSKYNYISIWFPRILLLQLQAVLTIIHIDEDPWWRTQFQYYAKQYNFRYVSTLFPPLDRTK